MPTILTLTDSNIIHSYHTVLFFVKVGIVLVMLWEEIHNFALYYLHHDMDGEPSSTQGQCDLFSVLHESSPAFRLTIAWLSHSIESKSGFLLFGQDRNLDIITTNPIWPNESGSLIDHIVITLITCLSHMPFVTMLFFLVSNIDKCLHVLGFCFCVEAAELRRYFHKQHDQKYLQECSCVLL